VPQVLLFKVGRTKNLPEARKAASERANRCRYTLDFVQHTSYHKYLENAVHEMLKQTRVVNPDLKDGKTEWFLCPLERIQKSILVLQSFLELVY